jgi:hypothetical protein
VCYIKDKDTLCYNLAKLHVASSTDSLITPPLNHTERSEFVRDRCCQISHFCTIQQLTPTDHSKNYYWTQHNNQRPLIMRKTVIDYRPSERTVTNNRVFRFLRRSLCVSGVADTIEYIRTSTMFGLSVGMCLLVHLGICIRSFKFRAFKMSINLAWSLKGYGKPTYLQC